LLSALGFSPRACREHPCECLENFVPNIKSAKKNMRKTRAATARNKAQRSALRTALRKAGAADATPDQQRSAVQLLDRAARKGLVHPNAAARRKSRMATKRG